jgi:hypothetical protein
MVSPFFLLFGEEGDINKPYQFHVKQRSCADVNSPYNRKCRTNSVVSVVPLDQSLLWAYDSKNLPKAACDSKNCFDVAYDTDTGENWPM